MRRACSRWSRNRRASERSCSLARSYGNFVARSAHAKAQVLATKSGEACCGRANKLPINASRTRTKGHPFRRIS